MSLEHNLQLSIHSYYVGEMGAGFRSCERILNSEEAADHIKYNTLQNLMFYIKPISSYFDVKYTYLDCRPAHSGWTLFNPTIINHDEGFLVLVRSSNYIIDNNGRYIIPREDGDLIRTEYVKVILDKNYNIIKQNLIKLNHYDKTNYPVDGLEDLRVFKIKNSYYVSGTIRNKYPYDGICRIGVAPYHIDSDEIGEIRVLDLSNNCHEKNWMPIENDHLPKWLYQSNVNNETKIINEDLSFSSVRCNFPAAKNFRGGSQLIKIKNNYYCLIHEVVAVDNKRIYCHRMVEWDSNLNMTRISKIFSLKENRSIEFSAGMCFDGSNINITFGLKDKEAYLASFSYENLESLFDFNHY